MLEEYVAKCIQCEGGRLAIVLDVLKPDIHVPINEAIHFGGSGGGVGVVVAFVMEVFFKYSTARLLL